ncbi:MAG: GNAT family N-acetyltransferase [Spirochaetales bacterium]|nr:MAG: GNAT family N-acetyltransferase [Spirochaetales bacterium]
MDEFRIIPYQPSHLDGVHEILFRTGYMGEDLIGRNAFNDRRLFGYIFCDYYLRFEPGNCFTALSSDMPERVLGYIIGAGDTRAQLYRFKKTYARKIVLRNSLITRLANPESFLMTKTIMAYFRQDLLTAETSILYRDYPAHLHINVLPGFQGKGIGAELMTAFEERMRMQSAPGIHLITASLNEKALRFYLKNNYRRYSEEEGDFWPGVTGVTSITFVKALKPA